MFKKLFISLTLILCLFTFHSALGGKYSFSEEEEKFINECVEKINKQVLKNQELLSSGKLDELQFAIDIRSSNEKDALGAISTLSAMNQHLNEFHKETSKNEFKIACYVLFTSRVEAGSGSLLNTMNKLYEDNKLENATYSEYINMVKDETGETFNPDDLTPVAVRDNVPYNASLASRELTEEILSRSLLGGKSYLGVLLHYDTYIKNKNYFINTNIALDERIPDIHSSFILSHERPTERSPLENWTNAFLEETQNLTCKLYKEYDNTHKLYVNIAFDLLTKQHYQNTSFTEQSFDPYSINENKINCNENDFDESLLKYVLTTNQYNDIPGIESDEDFKYFNRKLGFLAYNTKNHFYILHIEVESKDINKVDYNSFASDVYNQIPSSKSNLILIVVLSYTESNFASSTGGTKGIKYSFITGPGIEPGIFTGFENTAKGNAILLTPAISSQITPFSFFGRAVLLAYAKIPKPYIRYNIAVNPYCQIMRTINIARNVKGLINTRELIIITNVPSQPFNLSFSVSPPVYENIKYLSHKLVDEYIDQYHLNEAIIQVAGETDCSRKLDVGDVYDIYIKNKPPDYAYGKVTDYTQMAIDLAAAVAILLPTPYQVIAGGVAVVYYLNKGNTTNAAYEMAGIGLNLLTRQNVASFLGKLPWGKVIGTVLKPRKVEEIITNSDLLEFINSLKSRGINAEVIGDEVHLLKVDGQVSESIGRVYDNTLIIEDAGWSKQKLFGGDPVIVNKDIKIVDLENNVLDGKIELISDNKFRIKKTYVVDKGYGLNMSLDEIRVKYGEGGVRLVTETEKNADEIIIQARSPKNKSLAKGPVLSGIYDPLLDKIYFGQNFTNAQLNDVQIYRKFLDELHPILKNRLGEYQKLIDGKMIEADDIIFQKASKVASHSEIRALDEALKARESFLKRPITEEELSEFLLHNKALNGSGNVPPRCLHCWHLTDGLTVIGND